MNGRHIPQSLLAVTLMVWTCGYAQTDEENLLRPRPVALQFVVDAGARYVAAGRTAKREQLTRAAGVAPATVLVYSRASSFVHGSIPAGGLVMTNARLYRAPNVKFHSIGGVFELRESRETLTSHFGYLMLKLLGEETGAFTAVFNNEEQEFTLEYLQQFDMIFFNNTTFVERAFTTEA